MTFYKSFFLVWIHLSCVYSLLFHFFLLSFLFLLLEHSLCCDFGILFSSLFTLYPSHLFCVFNNHGHFGFRFISLNHWNPLLEGRFAKGKRGTFSRPDLFLTHLDASCLSLLLCPVDISNSTCLKKAHYLDFQANLFPFTTY